MDKEDHKDFLEKTQEDQKLLEIGLKMSRSAKKERLEDEVKRLRAEVGNLQVQNAEYSEIVQELSNKLKNYQNKYGIVFAKGDTATKK
jgi:FixJ family two-component response regulator